MTRNMNRQQIIDKLNVIAFSSYEYSETAREAISLLIEDEKNLEKQIPKKPIKQIWIDDEKRKGDVRLATKEDVLTKDNYLFVQKLCIEVMHRNSRLWDSKRN